MRGYQANGLSNPDREVGEAQRLVETLQEEQLQRSVPPRLVEEVRDGTERQWRDGLAAPDDLDEGSEHSTRRTSGNELSDGLGVAIEANGLARQLDEQSFFLFAIASLQC